MERESRPNPRSSLNEKRNRLRTTCSSVFPVGVMGTTEMMPLEDIPELKGSNLKEDILNTEPKKPLPNSKGDAQTEEEVEGVQVKSEPKQRDNLLFAAKSYSKVHDRQNPITGVGVESSDMVKFITSKRKQKSTL